MMILNLQMCSTWAMVGLIWFVQVVHYPLFEAVGPEQFPSYSKSHSRLTTWVVLPLMTAELVTSYLLWRSNPGWVEWCGLGLVLLLWLSTLVFFAPLHGRLARRFKETDWRLLVRANWFRTWIWSTRGLLVLLLGS